MRDWRKWAVKAAEWGVDYRASLRDLPVRPPIKPGEIAAQLAAAPPEQPENFAGIFADFERVIAPGMTHWQHPRFFAYFPANAAPASVVAEQLVSAIAAVCMLWQTSPAATELETRMIDWLRQAFGLPTGFSGVIQDTASTATLAAVLVMRERALDFAGNTAGLSGAPRLRVYCSGEAHTSIDRAIWFSGIGADNLVRIPIKGPLRGADPEALRALIRADIDAGFKPAGIIANVGATGVGACDPVGAMAAIAREFDLYLHVDAAWAGVAMICPEFRSLVGGRRGGRQHRRQPAQVAWRAIALQRAFRARPRLALAHSRGAPGLSAHAWRGTGGQLQRMGRSAGPRVSRAQAVVPDARLWA